MEWAVDLARGIASLAEQAGAPVVGGDLSSAPPGVVVVSVTALGDLRGLRAGAALGRPARVTSSRSAARSGWSGGGLALLRARRDRPATACLPRMPAAPAGAAVGSVSGALAVRALMRYHRAPVPPWRAGPRAAAAGAHALIDVSDGLVTDLGRVAAASGVRVDLDGAVLRARFAAGPLRLALGEAEALHQVLSGGEEHSLVGVVRRRGVAARRRRRTPATGSTSRGGWSGGCCPTAGDGIRGHGRRRGARRAAAGTTSPADPADRDFVHCARSSQVRATEVPSRASVEAGRRERAAPRDGEPPALGASGGQRLTLPALRQEVQTLSRFGVTPASPTSALTRWMLGFQRRLVRRCECEMLCPKPGPLPQTSQLAATGESPESVVKGWSSAARTSRRATGQA